MAWLALKHSGEFVAIFEPVKETEKRVYANGGLILDLWGDWRIVADAYAMRAPFHGGWRKNPAYADKTDIRLIQIPEAVDSPEALERAKAIVAAYAAARDAFAVELESAHAAWKAAEAAFQQCRTRQAIAARDAAFAAARIAPGDAA